MIDLHKSVGCKLVSMVISHYHKTCKFCTYMEMLSSIRSVRCVGNSRTSSVLVFARGPIVTKKGVAFKKVPEPAEPEPSSDEIGVAGTAALALGLPSIPVLIWSEYTLATTGAGLPPGPSGLLGAAEGISYLAMVLIVAYSLYTKVSTGKGLPAGPSGLLGAVEGFSYLLLVAAVGAFGVSSGLRS
ncbi:hypothetical protein CEUSTIGMA_g6184.t1 [Chlamydomonas eustigma]|uniref:Uncharacterized protein n=1 Tax=Chlamydomonas eustigma TaxID=1157962 RepID=A0A250X6Q2_9CHLO|nr:hypothetical protein CEUSTIGMA_g6184.t1 [Chlamydomonas eustigma]|eukprot:GAX78747.1 hypothetical protein CEUSTIGMA_g6184.t1 [Chlamydomonas eustigma]